MRLRLKDIIDLEYLIRQDDELDTQNKIQACQIRDRDIYSRIADRGKDKKTLLLNWLYHRRIQYLDDKEKNDFPVLPGILFAKLYKALAYGVAGSGFFLGLSIVISFLAYHGNQPVNVTLFIFVFVLLPLALSLLSFFSCFRRLFRRRGSEGSYRFSGIHLFLSTVMFKGLSGLLHKIDWEIFNKGLDTIETCALIIKMKKHQYQGLLFWPVFILITLFSISFSAGALGGTFFRVMVSDIAFGWQSTILTSGRIVHAIVSAMAWPWSGWMPVFIASPGMDQIEGSRIVLKDGISVLATHNLVSWWPFLCMAIFFYAVLPRGVLILTAFFAQRRALHRLDFNTPDFNDLVARMQTPLLCIEACEKPVSHSIEENPIKKMDRAPQFLEESESCRYRNYEQSAIMLISRQVYAQKAEKVVRQGIETGLFYKVKQVFGISFIFDTDEDVIRKINPDGVDQVILVQEVWQPPIRGILFYIQQLQASLPDGMPVLVLLTNDAGQSKLSVDQNDIDFEIWKKAVFALGNSKIRVKRFIGHDS